MNEQQKPQDFTAGYKVVPDEPTAEMREAGHRAAWHRTPSLFDDSDAANVYRAMLAAAPAAPERDPELARDAERYRWLRAYNTAKHTAVTEAFFLGDENLDAAIDAAIAAEKGGQP